MKTRLLALAVSLLAFASLIRGSLAGAGPVSADDQKGQLYQHYDDLFRLLLSWSEEKMGKSILKYESLLPGSLPKKVTVSGTHYELGYLVGLIARESGQKLGRRTEANAELNRRIVSMYSDLYPPHLEKARGIAAAFGMSFDEVDLTALEHDFEAKLWWDLFKYSQFNDLTGFSSPTTQCSVLSYYLEGERKHLVGRNFDNPADRPVFLVASGLQGVYRSIGHSVYQLHQWMPDGINEKGLFAGVASLVDPPQYMGFKDSPTYPNVPSVQAIHLLRIVLDSCATVDEALELIKRTNVWFPVEVNHFLIADALGNSVVVEFDKDKRLQVIRRQSPFLVMTNTALQEGSSYACKSCWRYRTATDLLSKRISDMGDVAHTMGAMWFRAGGTRTLWTVLADLSKKEMLVAYLADNFVSIHSFDFSSARLTWPQLALGGGYESTMLISNKRDAAWTGRIHLKQGNDERWSGGWQHNGQDGTGTEGIDVSIAPGGTSKIRLSGDSTTRSGYLQMEGANQSAVSDLAVSCFYNYVANGGLVESTGSSAGEPGRTYSFPVEKTATINTGFAWAPSSVTTPFTIVLTLFDADGNQAQRKTLTYAGHEARFFDQVFDNVPNSFMGRIRLESQEKIHLEVLRLEQTGTGFQLTSTPPDRNP